MGLFALKGLLSFAWLIYLGYSYVSYVRRVSLILLKWLLRNNNTYCWRVCSKYFGVKLVIQGSLKAVTPSREVNGLSPFNIDDENGDGI